ncbi:MAG: AMP-binding protein [Bdellovibrionota bacterium]
MEKIIINGITDWEAPGTEAFINPRLPSHDQEMMFDLLNHVPDLGSHILLMTSGSSVKNSLGHKWVAISKQSMLVSATAVNATIQSDSSDIWINVLPVFHVGGLAIYARSHLSKARVVDFTAEYGKWDCLKFYEFVLENSGTLTSLVPAQIHDIVAAGLRSPPGLRAVFVGGSFMNELLYRRAIDLGWKLAVTYGMTECSSQVATSHLCNDALEILPHMEVSVSCDGRFRISSQSLFSGYIIQENGKAKFIDPKTDGAFLSDDIGHVEGRRLFVKGRIGDFFKIGAESINLRRLESILSEVMLRIRPAFDAAIIVMPDARLGHAIHMASTDETGAKEIIKAYNERVLPFEKIREHHFIPGPPGLPVLPRSPLGKIKMGELVEKLSR